MAKPLTRAQALENRAFLSLLRRTGNVRLACRELGLKYGTMQHRRRQHPGFALKWDAALVFFQASFDKLRMNGGVKGLGRGLAPDPSTSCAGPPPRRTAAGRSDSFRTASGEPHLVRLKSGKLQVRRAQAGKLTPAAEQAFLAAVSATCNLSLAAAAVGSCFGAFNRRRKKDPAFARELRLALKEGYEALEMALLESTLPSSHEHGDWRSNEPPAIPPMSASEALQLMYLHQKAALLLEEPTPMRRRRGESNEARNERLALMAEARDRRAREAFEVAEAERWAEGLPPFGLAGEDVRRRLGLPDLAQVTGWSRKDPAKGGHGERALFGGWRIEEMEQQRDEEGWGGSRE
jgi:hypothetical protein